LKLEEKYEDISGVISDAVNRRTTDNTMTRTYFLSSSLLIRENKRSLHGFFC
jgi:hypothetical protein